MRRIYSLLFVAVIAGMVCLSPQSLFAEDKPDWQFGVSFSYLNGKYGTNERSEIYYAAASIKRYFEKGDFAVTVPYLNTPSSGFIFVDGSAEPVPGAGGGSGLGDVILKGRFYAVEQTGPLPFIDLVGSVKLPTASKSKGLGTGKADFTVGAEFSRVLPDRRWVVLGELGYGFLGDPSGYDLENRWLYSIGLSCQASPKVRVSGYLDGRTAIFRGNDDPLSMLFIGEFKIRPSFRMDTMLEVGLNNGSPDVGITLGFRKRI